MPGSESDDDVTEMVSPPGPATWAVGEEMRESGSSCARTRLPNSRCDLPLARTLMLRNFIRLGVVEAVVAVAESAPLLD